MSEEEWRPVVGFEGCYSVSSLGAVRSEPRTTITARGHVRRTQGLLLSQPCASGYCVVGLCKDGKITTRTTHSIVAEAFLGPRPHGHQINHIDGVKTNNRPDNLEYVTPAQNSSHAARVGLKPSGDRHWTRVRPDRVARGDASWSRLNADRLARGEAVATAKLTADAVRAVRAMRASGASFATIGKAFGISRMTAFQVCSGRTWRHVK